MTSSATPSAASSASSASSGRPAAPSPRGRGLRPVTRSHPRRIAGIATVAGLLATAIGDAAPEGLHWDGPGPALFGGLALVVAVVPGRAMVLLAVLGSALFLYPTLTLPESLVRFADPGAALIWSSALLQVLGLVATVVAGTAVLWPRRRGTRPAP